MKGGEIKLHRLALMGAAAYCALGDDDCAENLAKQASKLQRLFDDDQESAKHTMPDNIPN